MKLKYRNRELKLLPLKYAKIENITDYLENFEQKRLTETEREYLDEALFVQAASELIARLEKTNPHGLNQIKDAIPLHVTQYKSEQGDIFYALRMSNDIHIHCKPSLYNISPAKQTASYKGSFPGISIIYTETTQLTLF